MKFKLALVSVIVLVVLGLFTYEQFFSSFPKGELAPEFALSDLNGKTVRLSDLKGKNVIVHFWATWCPQCVEELPSLNNFASTHTDIDVLAVSEDEAGAEVVSNFFAKKKPFFTVLLDPEGRVADRYKSYRVPESYLLDKEGKLLKRFVGSVSWMSPNVINEVRELLDLKAP